MAGTHPGAAGSPRSTQRPAGSGGALRRTLRRALPQGTNRARPGYLVWGAALLTAVTLLGGLEIHPPGESHDPIAGLSGAQQETYFPAASHPAGRPHAETAAPVLRPFCAVCLTRVQGSGAHLAQHPGLAAPAAGHSLPLLAAVSPLQKSLRPDGARAPPLA